VKAQRCWVSGAVTVMVTGVVRQPASEIRRATDAKTEHNPTLKTAKQRSARVLRLHILPTEVGSVAALVGGDKRIVTAHTEAVKVALAELERFAAARIRGAKCNADRRTGNIVAALFEHEISRALDPHLHTHCIIFNATHDPEEKRWKALQNYEMLGAQKFVENVYYHELARVLGSFGYPITNAARGDFELAEIPRDVCERFSKRHREIDEKTQEFLASIDENLRQEMNQ
jgi:conjugative relaxase-like TrwC/TraI family protein